MKDKKEFFWIALFLITGNIGALLLLDRVGIGKIVNVDLVITIATVACLIISGYAFYRFANAVR